jgi:cobalt-precorrin-7 (C5)-methyltransferase
MKIVGVGCGPGMLTEKGAQVIGQARVIYGSGRAIGLARPYIPAACEVHEIADYKALRALPDKAVVLSTGDPMLAGLGYLDGEVISGISSLQVAAARLRIPLTRLAVVSAHGKGHAGAVRDAVDEIRRGKIVFLLADPEFSLDAFGNELKKAGLDADIAVCENLGYPDERVAVGTTKNLPEVHKPGLYVLLAGPFSPR